MGGADKPVIAVVDNSLYITGAFNCIWHNVQALARDYRFIFIVPEGATHKPMIEDAGVSVYEVPFLEVHKGLKMLRYFSTLRKNAGLVNQILSDENVDVLHMNDLYNMVGWKLKKTNPDLKLIYHIRLRKSSYINRVYPLFRKRIQVADHLISMSQVAKDDMELDPIEVIYDSRDFAEKHPAYEVRKEGPFTLLCLSNLMPGKGQDLALQAFSKVCEIRDDVQLNIVGGAPEGSPFVDRLHQYVKEKGLEGQVSFKAFVSDIEAEMKSADMVINFSESESFSMVCLEALGFGIPLISSDCGGPSEIIDHGETGIIVPNRDVQGMSRAILDLLDDAEQRLQFSASSKDRVREKFSPTNTTERLRAVYEQLIQEKKKQ